jgi:integrase
MLRISKSYQRIKKQDVITDPKTKKSNRVIEMPDFLCEEMQDYFGMLYDLKPDERIFTITKSYLHHEMDRGAKESGVKRIRIHDLRHSHVSLLIEMGFTAVALSGLTKQDYIVKHLLNRDVVVQANPKVYKALKNQLAEVLTELQRIENGDVIDDGLLAIVRLIADILGKMKGEIE